METPSQILIYFMCFYWNHGTNVELVFEFFNVRLQMRNDCIMMCCHVSLHSFNTSDVHFNFRFLDAYKSHGLDFWTLTPQNEPLCGIVYPCAYTRTMNMSPDGEKDWVINYLGPTLHANGYGDIQIMIADEQRPFLPFWLCSVSLKFIISTSI